MAEAVAGSSNWQHDVQTVTTTVLTTTGGTLWSAATRLCQYLESEAHVVGLQRPGVKVRRLSPVSEECALTSCIKSCSAPRALRAVQHNPLLPLSRTAASLAQHTCCCLFGSLHSLHVET